MSKYDYLIVGSGLYGSIFAYETKKVLSDLLISMVIPWGLEPQTL